MRIRPPSVIPVLIMAVLPPEPAGGAPPALPPLVENGPSFQLPAGDARLVYRRSDTALAPVLEFWAEHGREWRIHWDAALGTPRFLQPVRFVSIVEPEAAGPFPDLYVLRSGVESFIASTSSLLGVGPEELGEPLIYRVGRSWVLVFGQETPGGIPVRGASVRVVVTEYGELAWLKAFVARGVGDPDGSVLEREDVELIALGAGAEVLDARLQMGFSPPGAGSPLPIWSLAVAEADGQERIAEWIVDARSGDVLARRIVVKHFEATGIVLGRSAPGNDLFASPKGTIPELTPLPGAVIRNERGRELAMTAPDGSVSLELEQNPAILRISLESGDFFHPGAYPRANEHNYASLLEIRPVDATLVPIQLLPEEDIDGNGIPDLVAAFSPGEPRLVVFNERNLLSSYTLRSWWIQGYLHARSMLASVSDTLERFELSGAPFLPLAPLRVKPSSGGWVQEYVPPGPRSSGFGEVTSALTFAAGFDPEGLPVEEPVLPTIFLHEVGHHVFHSLTAARDSRPADVEEGVADVLVGFATGECRIGFKSPYDATALGFCLGAEGDFRRQLRAKVGNAFWSLQQKLLARTRDGREDAQPQVAPGLLLHWLAFNRVQDADALIFDSSRSIADELIAIDRQQLFTRQGLPCDAPCHEAEIIAAFSERRFFDAPFVRGDANIDERIDISDPISILNFLFGGRDRPHDCRNAMDADDDGDVSITDAIRVLVHLFQGADPLPAPYPDCGLDPAPPEDPQNLGCLEFGCPR